MAAHEEVHEFLHAELRFPITDSAYLIDLAGREEVAFFHGPAVRPGPHFERLVRYAREGRIAALHSVNVCIGNHPDAPTRQQVAVALGTLNELGIRVPVWTNHGSVHELANLGGAAPVYQQGDLPSSDSYVLDLLLSAGVRWFWMDHHTTNDFAEFRDGAGLVRRESTRAGFPVRTFRRFRGALPKAPDTHSMAWQLCEGHLERLVRERAAVVIYQHWGCRRDPEGNPLTATSPILPEATRASLRMLAIYRDQGHIAVMRLQDLLDELSGAQE